MSSDLYQFNLEPTGFSHDPDGVLREMLRMGALRKVEPQQTGVVCGVNGMFWEGFCPEHEDNSCGARRVVVVEVDDE